MKDTYIILKKPKGIDLSFLGKSPIQAELTEEEITHMLLWNGCLSGEVGKCHRCPIIKEKLKKVLGVEK